MKQPAKINSKLLRFWTRKQHAEIQRVKKSLLADPFQFIYEKPVHHRDLPSRPAKAKQADFQPDYEGLSELDIPLYGLLAFIGLALHPYPAISFTN